MGVLSQVVPMSLLGVVSSSFSGCVPVIVMSAGPRSYPPGAQCQWPVAGFSAGLARPDGARVARQDAVKLAAGADAELGGDLAQVLLDRAGADEQPGAGRRVRQESGPAA